MSTNRVNITNADVKYIAFDNLTDDRGRPIGVSIARFESDFVDAPNGGWDVPAGHYYLVRMHATRAGQPYGPLQMSLNFSDLDAREKYITKRVAAMRKTYTKKFKGE